MIDLVVRGSIWLSLAAFVAAQIGFRRRDAPRHRWPLTLYWTGALLLVGHVVAVFEWHHDWSNARAVAATARETARVFGLDWGGGVWVNYAFIAIWFADAARRTWPSVRARPALTPLGWIARIAAFVVIFNGAIVFVPWPRNLLGVAVVVLLVWAWRPTTPVTARSAGRT